LATWTLSGERTKNGVAHVVPLSAPAGDLLNERLPNDANEARRALIDLRAAGTLALPGAAGTPFGDWSQSNRALDAAIVNTRTKNAAASRTTAAPLIAWTLHDLRRTVATCSALACALK
jgi:integrase